MIVKIVDLMFVVFKKYFENERSREYSKIERIILAIIEDLLKSKATDIYQDQIEGLYYLSNDDFNFRILIFSNLNILKVTNTKDTIADKFDKTFIEEIVRVVERENTRRIDVVQKIIECNIEVMADRFHRSLVQLNDKDQFLTINEVYLENC